MVGGRFMKFCVVGGIGFLVDAMLLELGVRAGLITPVARLFSVMVAMQVTYALHRAFTFREADVRGVRPWAKFLLSNALGAAVNYGVFLGVLAVLVLDSALLERQAALVAGTAVALGFNYWANKRFVFKGAA